MQDVVARISNSTLCGPEEPAHAHVVVVVDVGVSFAGEFHAAFGGTSPTASTAATAVFVRRNLMRSRFGALRTCVFVCTRAQRLRELSGTSDHDVPDEIN